MPDAKSVVVIACQIPKSVLKVVKYGGYTQYNLFGYGGLCQMMRRILYDVSRFIKGIWL